MRSFLYIFLSVVIVSGCQTLTRFKPESYYRESFSYSVNAEGLVFYYTPKSDGSVMFLVKNRSNSLIRNIDMEFLLEKARSFDYKSFGMLKNFDFREFTLKNLRDSREIIVRYRYNSSPEDLFLNPADKQGDIVPNLIQGEVLIPLPQK